MAKRRPILVVGDKFREFSSEKAVLTLSQLQGLLDIPAGLALCEPLFLIPGQGLGEKDIESVLARAQTSAHRDQFDFSLWHSLPKRAERALSHKHRAKNTLISAPRRIDASLFELDFLVDEDCELMDDHQTGQHLQGMLVVEAARQSFLAVTEAFLLPRDGSKSYFVFNSLAAEYKRFMFPVPALMRYRVRERDDSGHNPRFVVDIHFEQAGQEAAKVTCGFTVMPDWRIRKIEQTLAQQAVERHFADLGTSIAAIRPPAAALILG
ncbi:AfsA-related hotdog domain-containing protein [Telmatospirillum siberiense]|uniref:AfsA-related hotdog domain-containing protein n=1 Tax=Telmatospirillum siberiense TaxID=382514 RepID=UPI0013040D52|nr:AfsA-related hotdog domain-containing protein [Telmatospirillum siberiense]